MPALGKTRDQARRILCESNLKTIGMADIMYSQECDNWHVPIFNGSVPENWLWLQNPLFTILVDLKGRHNEEYQDIFEEKAMTLLKDFKCPNDKRTVENGGLHPHGYIITQGVSYAMNAECLYGPGRTWCYYRGLEEPGLAHCVKTSQVVKPDEKIFFIDGQWFAACMDGSDYEKVWDLCGDVMSCIEWDTAAYRHDEGANILFYDAHVKWMPKQEIWPHRKKAPEQMEALKAIWVPVPGKRTLPCPE